MPRFVSVVLTAAFVAAALARAPSASAATGITRMSCKGAILGFTPLGDHRLASYEDGHGHRIELWCTRRIFDSQFDLRITLNAPAQGSGEPGLPAAPDRLATVGGCFFDNGDNEGPIIIRGADGAYARLEWINEDPSHRRIYRFSYDFTTGLVTVTATVSGCAPMVKVVAPQPSYHQLWLQLPRPETQACAVGSLAAAAPSP